MGGFGEIRLGRDYTPTFWNWTTFDPFGTVGVGASRPTSAWKSPAWRRAVRTAPWCAPTTRSATSCRPWAASTARSCSRAGVKASTGNKYYGVAASVTPRVRSTWPAPTA
ncbi:MAG: hypothetical protein MZW92_63515 [Comamonadaceae bacterium]|nr:hypothetical protein [Comamonadaceae bacterium]